MTEVLFPCPITREDWARSLNARAQVEQEMFNVAQAGTPVTPEQLRAWAIKLGVPSEWTQFGKRVTTELDQLRSTVRIQTQALHTVRAIARPQAEAHVFAQAITEVVTDVLNDAPAAEMTAA